MRRTAVGIDLGTSDVFAANVGRKGVEIVQNSVSERRTPALVSFTPRRRLVGDAAAPQLKSNYRNSCRGLKHLVGRVPGSPDVKAEDFWALCPLAASDTGEVGYQVSYREKPLCVSATICLSMLVSSIIATCKAWTKMEVEELVFAIPSYFDERMRQACLDAIQIAGLKCLRLLHESTALAIAWRFERHNFKDDEPITVMFCSAGHSGFMAAIARYEKGSVSILSEAYDRSVSGRAMDKVLLDMFVASLKKQGASDPLSSAKALLKLEEAATKVKKTLSVVDEAKAVAECVSEDFDLSCDVKRSDFEEACSSMSEAIKNCVAKVMSEAQVALEDIQQVEIVGGCSRVPFIQRAVKEAVAGKELCTSLNADEAVAKGCAWQAAMLSPSVRLVPIPLKESGTNPIYLQWKSSEAIESDAATAASEEDVSRLLIFEAHAGPGASAEVGLKCQGQVQVSAVRMDTEGHSSELGTWTLEFPKKSMENVELNCFISLDGHFSIEKAAVCVGKKPVAAKDASPSADTKPTETEGEAKEGSPEAKSEPKEGVEEEAAKEEGKEEGKEEEGKEEDKEEEGQDSKDQAAEAAKPAKEEEEEGKESSEEQPAKPQAEGEEESKGPEDQESKADDQEPKEENGEKTGTGAESEATSNKNPESSPVASEDASDAQDGAEDKKGFNWKFWKWGRGDNGKDEAQEGETAPASAQKKRQVGTAQGDSSTVKRTTVPVKKLRDAGFGLPSDGLQEAKKQELAYRATEEAIKEAEKHRNDFEAYIFELRDRVGGADPLFSEYSSPAEQDKLKEELEEAENWSYDHTEEESDVYKTKLNKLKSLEKDCSNRKANWQSVESKTKALKTSIKKYKAAAISPICDHIAKEKLDTVIEECDKNAEWLSELEKKQADHKKWESPVLSATELTVRNSTLTTNATKVLSEPKPKPPPKEKEESKDAATDGNSTPAGDFPEAAALAAKKNRQKWMGLAAAALALPLLAVLGGCGESFGVASPLGLECPIPAWMLGATDPDMYEDPPDDDDDTDGDAPVTTEGDL
mmetsp:Transcript_30576/g.65916  ORF Transcript_30576/g.65916 Transcript_30576/m.65916 type:complete len:1037 (+) Transcript_30576:235-3345(+)|eukprot:CAMPEP_0206428076 /NCGR_PEP_ID=MMETSP0324_2-20121206/5434_1 /ASSEMBLY_ACC=CAM_ASM_000836 /TAXON_ID=2866 /ORGANISM="Crypthecodinium cohnii, Strain Seligo" /LENGTH=1036 /DNA_ID=CAMNT_0053893505 /DNA_START=179 /DNA_END=3289 /DNA_ORIENTATION=-